MKIKVLAFWGIVGALWILGQPSCKAQTAQQRQSEILLQIDGKPITRAEFEYAYRKNKNTESNAALSLAEYLDLFINYKLKVAQAERQHLDTLTSFKEEYRKHSQAQLKEVLIDRQFIDSVAYSLYEKQRVRMAGRPVLKMSHILLEVSQNASPNERQAQAQKADSLYQAIVGGADFSQIAEQYSDDKQSALRGGRLNDIYPGLTVQSFEDQVYGMKAGELSRPFLTEFGYHIVWLHERKAFDDYETLYPQIIASLKRQNIEEIAANFRLEQYMALGYRSKQQVMDSLMQVKLEQEEDLRHLLQEYHDGLLLYEAYQREVLLPVVRHEREEALSDWYKKNKKKYRWDTPRFKGYVVGAKQKRVAEQAVKMMKKNLPEDGNWQRLFKDNLNKDSLQVMALGVFLVAKGENSTIDNLVFGDKTAAIKKVNPSYPITLTVGKKLKQAQSYKDVRSRVESDYIEVVNRAWTERLRREIPFTINYDIFQTIQQND